MLVIRRFLDARRRAEDDRGAALVAVLVVMLVGFVAAALAAASVVFTIRTNAGNKSATQAFVAAESGRDQMLATLLGSPCTKSISDATAAPYYFSVSATFGPDASHLADACLGTTAASMIRIVASGKGPDGSRTTIQSLYQRPVSISNSPGGTMSYFDGSFLATQSNYTGDLVIRNGPYACNSTSTINGDLWVLNGPVDLSANCVISGSVYAQGDITASGGNGATVKGNLFTAGNVNLSANNFVLGTTGDSTAGNVYADGAFTLGSSKPQIPGSYSVGGSATLSGGAAVGTPGQSVANCASSPTPAANASLCGSPRATPATDRISPSLSTVYSMTTWRDLSTSRAAWGSGVDWKPGPCDGSDVFAILAAGPTAPNTRIGIDYSSCTGPVTIALSGGAANLASDAVLLVASGSAMTVTASAALNSSTSAQLFFVHADGVIGDSAPNCTSGSASDALALPSTVTARLMFYTPCGLNRSSQNGLTFNGQFYANNDGSAHWVHPEFTCQAMKWSPTIDLGCKVATATATPGTTTTTLLPPTLLSQSEQ